MDRVLLLSDSEFYQKNLTLIINILIENDYSLRFIFFIHSMTESEAYNVEEQRHMIVTMKMKKRCYILIHCIIYSIDNRQFNNNRENIKISYYSSY